MNLGSIRTLAQITSLTQDIFYKFLDRREIKAHRAAELEKQKNSKVKTKAKIKKKVKP